MQPGDPRRAGAFATLVGARPDAEGGEAVWPASTLPVAALVPPVLAIVVILIARIRRDEIAGLLDDATVKRGNSTKSGA